LVLSLIILLLISLSQVESKVTTGSFQETGRNWQFLGKFVFQSNGISNILNYTIETSNPNLRVLLYFWDNPDRDTPGSNFYSDFEAYYNGDIDCANLSSRTIGGGNRPVVSGVSDTFGPSSNVRPYWWFVAVSDCTATSLNVQSFRLVFQQTNATHWFFEFSWDEWFIGPFTMVFMVIYILIFSVHAYGCIQLWRIEAYHSIIRLYTLGVFLQLVSVVTLFFHYSAYAYNGIGSPGLYAIGTLIGMASQLALLFLCILIAKGWAITTSYITQKYLLLAITVILILVFLTLFFWTEFLLDPMYTLYTYETIPGVIILVIRVLLVFWFLWSLRDTLRSETNPEKRKFYLPFSFVYGCWILSLPFIAVILGFLDTTLRLKIITITTMFCDLVGFSILGYLFWPSRARDYFSIRSSALLEKNANSSLIKDSHL